jgi:hypothetical protein
MKNFYTKQRKNLMFTQKSFCIGLLVGVIGLLMLNTNLCAQIYEPEGLNMPGEWNTWTNPPVNNLALASATQVAGGRVTKITIGTTRWQTIFHVAASGGDLVDGNFDWLFTSGPEANAFANKWAGVNVTMNSLQEYTYQSAIDNNIALSDDKWYTVVWEDAGYANTHAIFMETTNEPVEILTVSVPAEVAAGEVVDITLTTDQTPSPEEVFYVRYTTTDWNSSVVIPVNMTGSTGIASIPGQIEGTTVQYYALSSTVTDLSADIDLLTIRINNNLGANYAYTVGGSQPDFISWANLQWPADGQIEPGQDFDVYAQVYAEGITDVVGQGAGIQAWIGYSTDNSNPSGWTEWVPASFSNDVGNNDEFLANIGASIVTEGIYYYASRFQLDDQSFVYGGYSDVSGGFWDGTTNISGVLTVAGIPDPEINWVNLQWPADGQIEPGQDFDVYAQVYAIGITEAVGQGEGIQCWIGYSDENTDPAGWTDWEPATFNNDVGNNDEFLANIGASIVTEGTYYYASRFQLDDQSFVYGGYSIDNGGFWDGTTNVSGVLTVTFIQEPGINWANLQWPGSGLIAPGEDYDVFGQVFVQGITEAVGQGAGIQAWIGYSTEDTDPSVWTNWVPATFNADAGNNDEYLANIGILLADEGIYYYATRFQFEAQDFVYGGYSDFGGGFWDGIDNVSGVLAVSTTPPDPFIGFANIQWPGSGSIEPGQEFSVYAQVYAEGITDAVGQGEGIQSWIGYSTDNSDPSTWTNWIVASFGNDQGNNDEYAADLGAAIVAEGVYYYASRFQLAEQDFVYGGFSEGGGGFWDGTSNISGVLTVSTTPPDPFIAFANIQWPESGTIVPGQQFDVFAQAWIEGITGQADPAPGLQSWIGYSTSDTDPALWTNWIIADFNGPSGNNDEFITNLSNEITSEGTYYYASRFLYLGQEFVYGGYSDGGGGFWDGITNVSGVLMVATELIYYPVLFTVTDATGIYTNIKFKGEMTNWELVDMVQFGNVWTVTLDLLPGIYEWGVIEDDGSADGIWLVQGPNLELTVDPEGNISGDTTYTVTYYVGLDEQKMDVTLYPNPFNNSITVESTEDVTVQLFDVSGRIVVSQSFTGNKQQIQTENLPSGVYMIRVTSSNQIRNHLLIKQ